LKDLIEEYQRSSALLDSKISELGNLMTAAKKGKKAMTSEYYNLNNRRIHLLKMRGDLDHAILQMKEYKD